MLKSLKFFSPDLTFIIIINRIFIQDINHFSPNRTVINVSPVNVSPLMRLNCKLKVFLVIKPELSNIVFRPLSLFLTSKFYLKNI